MDFKKLKKPQLFSFEFSILSIFITLFLIVMITIIIIFNIRLSTMTSEFASEEMLYLNDKTRKHIHWLLNDILYASNFSVGLIERHTIETNNEDEMIDYTYNTLKSLPNANMVYYGDEQGNFVAASRADDNTYYNEIFDLRQVPKVHKYVMRDAAGKIVSTKNSEVFDYDPRKRPWYLKAKQEMHSTWSNAYVFRTGSKNQSMGITAATPVINDNKLAGVFGIDIRLDTVSNFLTMQKIGETGIVAIASDKGEIIAYPNVDELNQIVSKKGHNILTSDLNEKQINQALVEYRKNKKLIFKFHYNDITYFALVKPVSEFTEQQWYSIIVVPLKEFTGEIIQADKITLIISLALLILGVLFITGFSKKITKSIKIVTEYTKKIKNFDLEDTKKIDTHIKEIRILADSVESMRHGLKSFRKYVPADLVRTLIQKGEDAKIGGTQKDMTVMFSDIQNFTDITERSNIEELMVHLCNYFDELTKIIQEHKGTVDKFIGDAIMVFWNAPNDDPTHCLNACLTAIACQKRLRILNKEWVDQGKPELYTRIGLSTGKVIVGNLGSSERLNYTVVGDTINRASRYEDLNKAYHTQIIIDDAIKSAVSDSFLARKIDSVAVKGRSESSFIYELYEKSDPKLEQEINWLNQQFELGYAAYKNKDWTAAIQSFQIIKDQYPNDLISDLFIDRCKTFMEKGAPDNWDGVWRYQKKMGEG